MRSDEPLKPPTPPWVPRAIHAGQVYLFTFPSGERRRLLVKEVLGGANPDVILSVAMLGLLRDVRVPLSVLADPCARAVERC